MLRELLQLSLACTFVVLSNAFSATPIGLRNFVAGMSVGSCSSNHYSSAVLHHRSLRGRDHGVSITMQGGIGGWIKRAIQENMGNAPEQPQQPKKAGPRAKQDLRPIKTVEEDDDVVRPDYNFKFSSRAKSLLEVDTARVSETTAKGTPKLDNNIQGVVPGDEEAVVDKRFYEVALDRPTGIEFATDLSLKYVYVMEIKENSAADLSPTPIDVGNQLVAINGEDCIGLRFADVAGLLAKEPSKPLNFRFFRGSKQELLAAVGRQDYVATTARITAIMPGDSTEEKTVEAAAGAQMRDVLRGNGIEVYRIQSGRFSNCNGKQLCGTCIVDVKEGAEFTNSKSIDEANFLRRMPESYRLSCCVNVYGDVKVKTLPETGKKFIEFS